MIKTALMCLALTVFYEARGEPTIGQYAVAEVVINRANNRDLSICEVIYEPGQFSGVSKWKKPKSDNPVFLKSLSIAKAALESPTNYTNGANYFRIHSLKVKNKKVKKIGNHIFY